MWPMLLVQSQQSLWVLSALSSCYMMLSYAHVYILHWQSIYNTGSVSSKTTVPKWYDKKIHWACVISRDWSLFSHRLNQNFVQDYFSRSGRYRPRSSPLWIQAHDLSWLQDHKNVTFQRILHWAQCIDCCRRCIFSWNPRLNHPVSGWRNHWSWSSRRI